MKWVLIGHRGVGKTSLLKRLEKYFSDQRVVFFDLDSEIEKSQNQSISEIFKSKGEEVFRNLETETLLRLQIHSDCVISLGAGFDLEKNSELLKNFFAIWVRRETDKLGRIFVDRPRLDSNVSRLDEYDQRFRIREQKYLKYSDVIYEMPEGIEVENEFEKSFFVEGACLDGTATVLDVHKFHKLNELISFQEIEFRTDLEGKKKFLDCKNQFPKSQRLISFRSPKDSEYDPDFEKSATQIRFDWALELGEPPSWFKRTLSNIVSLHSVGDFQKYEGLFHLKYSPLVHNFDELLSGFQWQQEDPDNRSFLPRSSDGSWKWFRQFMKGRQKINFLSSGQRSASDQPTIYQWLATNPSSHFSAVLGLPIVHSRTPLEQQSFFQQKNLSCLAIPVSKDHFSKSFSVLSLLGLQAAAVTSPLKNEAFKLIEIPSKEALQLQSANTLVKVDGKWNCHNTDSEGFLASVASEDRSQNFLVWGGGGTLNVIQRAFPRAVFLSASSGLARDFSSKLPEDAIKQKWVLIWAAEPTADPPTDYTFSKVIDLNYTEYSKARDIAAIQNIPYVSGLQFFKEQARLQREYWSDKLTKTESRK